VPISIKIRYYGDEQVLKVYNSLPVGDLIDRIALITGMEAK